MVDREPRSLDIKRVLPVSELTGNKLSQFAEFTGAQVESNESQTKLRIGNVEVVLGDMPRVEIKNGDDRSTVFDLFDSAVIFSPTGDYAFVRPAVLPEEVDVVSVSKGKPDWGTLDVRQSLPHVKKAAELIRPQEAAA